MKEKTTSCIKRVGGAEICNYCNKTLIKHGKSSANKTRYRCKSCKKTQVENYTYKAYSSSLNQSIILLTKEGVGIRSTARLLRISPTTLLSRIISIAKNIRPPVSSRGKVFQVDKMRIYIRNKSRLTWIVYSPAPQRVPIESCANASSAKSSYEKLRKCLLTLRNLFELKEKRLL